MLFLTPPLWPRCTLSKGSCLVACDSNKWTSSRRGSGQESERTLAILQGLKKDVRYFFGLYKKMMSRFSNWFGGRVMRFEEWEREEDIVELFKGMFVERLRCLMSCCYLWRMGIVLSIELRDNLCDEDILLLRILIYLNIMRMVRSQGEYKTWE